LFAGRVAGARAHRRRVAGRSAGGRPGRSGGEGEATPAAGGPEGARMP